MEHEIMLNFFLNYFTFYLRLYVISPRQFTQTYTDEKFMFTATQ